MSLPHAHRPLPNPLPDRRTGGWQVVYTGFVLILLCFFIMLTSFASLEQSKITRFAQAFSHAVSVLSHGRSLEAGRTMIDADASVVDKEDPLARLFEKVRQLGDAGELGHLEVSRTPRGVVMTLSERLLFASGEADLSANAAAVLDKVGRIIRQVAVPVEIEGHTDDQPIRTVRFPSNWELSTARAVMVLRHLVARGHVSPDRITAVGFAQFRPVAPNDSAAQKAQNRRVEIVFKPEGRHAP